MKIFVMKINFKIRERLSPVTDILHRLVRVHACNLKVATCSMYELMTVGL